MDITKWLEARFLASHDKIAVVIGEKLEEFNKRNVLLSDFAHLQSIDSGFESLDFELRNIIKELSELKNLKVIEWETVNIYCDNYIKKELNHIIKRCCVAGWSTSNT